MNIYLVRHTSVSVSKKICYGQTDVELAESYPSELLGIKNKELLPTSFDVCISSPLLRCRKLAHDLYSGDVIFDERLMELNFGDWEMKTWDDLYSPEFEEWTSDYVNKQCPNGESYGFLAQRMAEFWHELSKKEYENVLIITHNGWLMALFAHILEHPLKNSFRLKVDYGGVSKVLLNKKPYFCNIEYINR